MIGVTQDIHFVDVADHLEAIAGVRRGLAQAERGQGRSVDEVFDELERES